jgi:uncharacterized protein YkwD
MKKFQIILFILFNQFINAQNLVESDLVALEQKLVNVINKHRLSLKLSELNPNQYLKMAADDHSNYLSSQKKLSHNQTDPKKHSPKDRVDFYKGNFNTIGENVLYSYLETKKHNDKDLDKVANDLFLQWKNSPPHYKNITSKDYTHGAIGLKYDQKTNKIFATHVFGKLGEKIPKQLSNNAFGIKEKSDKCRDVELSVQRVIGNNIEIEGTDVVLYFYDKEKFFNIFSGPNDGIAIDFIEKSQMTCGKENNFDDSLIYDGVLSKPIYSEELLKNDRAQNPVKLITKVGEVPTHLIGKELQTNVIIIINGCACSYVVPIEVESKNLELFTIEPKILVPSKKTLVNKGIILSETINFEFDRNKIKQKNIEYEKLFDKVHSYQIYSFSSVEGNEIQNTKLHQDRAIAIEQYAKTNLKFTQKPSIITAKENWEMCLLQLAMENEDDLISKPKSEIRNYINSNKEDWKEYLNNQRTSYLVVNYYGELKDTKCKDEEYQSIFLELNLRTSIFEKDFDKANYVLSEMKNLKNSYVIFEDVIFNELMTNPKLTQNATAVLCHNFEANHFKAMQFLNNWMPKKATNTKDTQFNLMLLYCNINKDLLDEWDVRLSKLTNIIKPYSLEKDYEVQENKLLLSNYHYIALYFSNHTNNYEQINNYFSKVFESFSNNIKNKEDRINLALFLNRWSSYDYSILLLRENLNEPFFSKEEALLLAQTAANLFKKNEEKLNLSILKKAYELAPKEWCDWQKENFNILRNSLIKTEFCKKCKVL